MAQIVESLPTVQETRVQSLSQKDPLEKEMAPTPEFLPGESHGQSSLVGYSPWDREESDTTERKHSAGLVEMQPSNKEILLTLSPFM